jgi:hypothetical protein
MNEEDMGDDFYDNDFDIENVIDGKTKKKKHNRNKENSEIIDNTNFNPYSQRKGTEKKQLKEKKQNKSLKELQGKVKNNAPKKQNSYNRQYSVDRRSENYNNNDNDNYDQQYDSDEQQYNNENEYEQEPNNEEMKYQKQKEYMERLLVDSEDEQIQQIKGQNANKLVQSQYQLHKKGSNREINNNNNNNKEYVSTNTINNNQHNHNQIEDEFKCSQCMSANFLDGKIRLKKKDNPVLVEPQEIK